MVDNRLAQIYRAQYTQSAPTLLDLMPQRRKKAEEEEPIDYLIERTSTWVHDRSASNFLNRASMRLLKCRA